MNNQVIKESLQKSVYEGTTSNSYIFSGESLASKKNIVNFFSKVLLCENEMKKLCGVCTSCKVFDSNNHIDIYNITTEKSIMSVDIIREQINQPINIAPNGKYKIFIVDKADHMNVQAQNALLKILEDTPYYAKIFLLATNKNIFLPTILSRCNIIDLNETSNNINFDLVDYTAKFLIELENQSIDGVFNFVDKLTQIKDQIQDVLSIMRFFYRDCMIIKNQSDYEHVSLSNIDLENSFLDKFELNQFIKKFDSVSFCIDVLSKNANFQMAIEIMLLKIRQA